MNMVTQFRMIKSLDGEKVMKVDQWRSFGDYLAASFFADLKPQILRPTLGNWDAVSYSGDEPRHA